MKTMKDIRCSVALVGMMCLTGGLVACSSNDEVNEPETVVEPPIVEEEQGLTAEMEEAINSGINGFSFNLFRVMANNSPRTSIVVSPYSVASVLAMLNDGADGATRKELLEALGFGSSTTRGVNEFFQKQLAVTADGDGARLQTANALFVNQGQELAKTYTADMTAYYDAMVEALDFSSPASVSRINGWCKEKTKGMIPEIINVLSPQTQAVVANAICFGAKWAEPFDKRDTQPGMFTTEDGKSIQADFMALGSTKGRTVSADTYDALRMDYAGERFAMTILLPKEGYDVSHVVGTLSTESWTELCRQLDAQEPWFTFVSLPRFTVEPREEGDISGVLKSLGIKSMFSAATAEFPQILADASLLYVSKVEHKAKIVVTEDGTEAAAATVSEITNGSPGHDYPYPTFIANHPFLFFISDRQTGCICFVGAYHG